MRTILIAAATAFMLLLDCHAEISGAFSVEWLTCASDVVAVGKITSVKNSKGPGQVVYADCVLTVSEVIEVPSVKEISFCYRYLSDGFDWTPPESEVLVFLHRHKTPYDEKRLHLYTDPYYEARLHNLLMPTTDNHPHSIITLSSPERFVFDGKGNQLTTRDSILQAARTAAAAIASRRELEPAFQLKPRRVAVDFGSEAWKILYAGSTCFIQVPEFMFPDSIR